MKSKNMLQFAMNFTAKLEDLFENSASDFEISKLFKERIKAYHDSLQNRFIENLGKDFLVKHTRTYDSIISDMYKTVLRQLFGTYLPMRNSIPITIVALGSYGREQLSIHSDIDLMIVFEKIEGYNSELIIEKLLYLAWDAGLKLGHRVHEVHDIVDASIEDITIHTAMLEARFIVGSNFTWHASQRELNRLRLHNQKAYILAKIEEAHIRRKKFPISMQPNIKEGVGSLRDANLLFWIAKTLFGIDKLIDLVPTYFKEEDYREYRIALELIFRLRSALHLASGKQQDQLTLDYIPQIKQMLGFKDEKRLVSKVLQAQAVIDRFTQIHVKKMIRGLLTNSYHFATIKKSRIKEGIYLIENRLYASYHTKPLSVDGLFELLLQLEDRAYNIDPSFIHFVAQSDIQRPFKVKTYRLFRTFFRRNHIYTHLKLFYDAGILEQLFSSFKKVMYLPQFDGYHHYSVDLHSIKCVEALETMSDTYIASLYEELHVDMRSLLKVVVLFHDLGKGRKQDHSEVGAKLISAFGKKLKFTEVQIETMALLVKQHITMSIVAQRENIYNEKTLYKFMAKIKNATNLKLLYILTYADISGVGANVYNTHSARLLNELYLAALEVASQSDRISDATKRLRIENRIKNSESYLSLPNILRKKVLQIESNLFYFKHQPNDIISIAKRVKDLQDYSYSIHTTGALSIEIFRRVPFNLGYLLGKLQHLDVISMEVFTLFDEVKYFKIEFLHTLESDALETINEIVEDSFDMERTITQAQVSIKKGEIAIDCEHSLKYAECVVHTANQRGLLSYIVDKFEQFNINIVTAKIHSTKHKARDHFLIEKQHNMCDNSKELITSIIKGNS